MTRAPDWFRDALAAPVTTGEIEVEGCPIAYRRWGADPAPAVVLVHGGGAHSRWWDHVAPLLADGRSVTALDLSGHGDSGRRDGYSFRTWAREILAVAGAFGNGEPPVVVAHSMGGQVAVEAAAQAGDNLKGVILVDAPVREPTPEEEAGLVRSAFGPLRLYPTAEDALARFRTVPDQPRSLPYVLDHVARTSLREVPGGWTWKFDPRFMASTDRPDLSRLPDIRSRVAMLRTQFGMVTPEMGDLIGRSTPGDPVVTEVPDAYHHVMLDQPLSLVAVVRALLAVWQHGGRSAG